MSIRVAFQKIIVFAQYRELLEMILYLALEQRLGYNPKNTQTMKCRICNLCIDIYSFQSWATFHSPFLHEHQSKVTFTSSLQDGLKAQKQFEL